MSRSTYIYILINRRTSQVDIACTVKNELFCRAYQNNWDQDTHQMIMTKDSYPLSDKIIDNWTDYKTRKILHDKF